MLQAVSYRIRFTATHLETMCDSRFRVKDIFDAGIRVLDFRDYKARARNRSLSSLSPLRVSKDMQDIRRIGHKSSARVRLGVLVDLVSRIWSPTVASEGRGMREDKPLKRRLPPNDSSRNE
jgi:hypothetical protein